MAQNFRARLVFFVEPLALVPGTKTSLSSQTAVRSLPNSHIYLHGMSKTVEFEMHARS